METQVNPIPKGYHTVTPYLIVKDANRAIDFYKRAFGAEEKFRIDAKEGKVGHAELKIGDSVIMLADEFPNMKAVAPNPEGSSFSILLYVENVDEFFDRAVDNGAVIVHPLKDQFYGDRMGTIKDPFGHVWNIASQVEVVPPEEMRKRAKEIFS